MEIDRSKISPMMQQYFEVKDKYTDCILFFRLGDFYEMFFDDAVVVSKALELTLTGRDCGLEERAPMCGVPYHAADMYIKRLIDMGFKVAVCEQLTDPAETKGIVVRDVIRVVTPGTLTESSMLDDGSNNYICSIYYDEESKTCGVASADLSTGEAALSYFEGKDLEAGVINELSRCKPAEIIFPQNFLSLKAAAEFVKVRLSCAVTLRDTICFTPFERHINTPSFPNKQQNGVLQGAPQCFFLHRGRLCCGMERYTLGYGQSYAHYPKRYQEPISCGLFCCKQSRLRTYGGKRRAP